MARVDEGRWAAAFLALMLALDGPLWPASITHRFR